jgi:hypothetical protein
MTKSRISQFDGRACGSSLGTAPTGTPSSAVGSVRTQLCSSARYAGSPCSISSAREIRKTVAISSSDRVIGLTQVSKTAASACNRSTNSVGTACDWKADRTVCRRSIAVASARSSSEGTREPVTCTVARWSGSPSSVRRLTSPSNPAAESATTANSTALPQLITC